jgi:hypothetical protein
MPADQIYHFISLNVPFIMMCHVTRVCCVRVQATEFKRWSDAALRRIETDCAEEMRLVREDYERKFARLERSLADQQSSSGASSPSLSPN